MDAGIRTCLLLLLKVGFFFLISTRDTRLFSRSTCKMGSCSATSWKRVLMHRHMLDNGCKASVHCAVHPGPTTTTAITLCRGALCASKIIYFPEKRKAHSNTRTMVGIFPLYSYQNILAAPDFPLGI